MRSCLSLLIYNIRLPLGVFRNEILIAIVTCIFESGNSPLMNIYRLISFLPVFSKILEKLVSIRLLELFDDEKLFISSFSLISGCSTNDAIKSYGQSIIYDSFV